MHKSNSFFTSWESPRMSPPTPPSVTSSPTAVSARVTKSCIGLLKHKLRKNEKGAQNAYLLDCFRTGTENRLLQLRETGL